MAALARVQRRLAAVQQSLAPPFAPTAHPSSEVDAQTDVLAAALLPTVSPDLLTFDAGATVTARTWRQRRQELEVIVPHEFGGMPPAPLRVNTTVMTDAAIRQWQDWLPGVKHRILEAYITLPAGETLTLTVKLWIPPGKGPFPVLLDCDGCWRYFSDDIVRSVLERGNIAASFDRTQTAADNKDEYRNTGLFRIFPDAEFMANSAWAWGCHRAVDALLTQSEVQRDGIALTGHSRGGKCALLAGATDERIAVVNPNNSGIGGAGLNRLKMEGSEEVASFTDRNGVPQNLFWFGKEWAAHAGRDAELPYDNHYLHAMVAPRCLLLTDAYEDTGANPAGTYAAAQAARKVFLLLGNEKGIGWAYRESGHNHAAEDCASGPPVAHMKSRVCAGLPHTGLSHTGLSG
jgi:dienelactone hydrolase